MYQFMWAVTVLIIFHFSFKIHVFFAPDHLKNDQIYQKMGALLKTKQVHQFSD